MYYLPDCLLIFSGENLIIHVGQMHNFKFHPTYICITQYQITDAL